MRRLCYALITLLMISSLTACGNDDAQTLVEGTVSYLLDEATKENFSEIEEESTEEIDTSLGTEAVTADSDVDVDLTLLSTTMLYGEIYNINVNPTPYLNKTMKVAGNYGLYEDVASGTKYFSVLTTDSTGCCVQGFEFILADEYTYPDDYPEMDEQITVIGELEVYEEDGYQFLRLKNARLE